MKKTQFKVEDNFGHILSKDSISPEQNTKLNTFFSQIIVNINFCININLFKPRQKKIIDIEPSAPPENKF